MRGLIADADPPCSYFRERMYAVGAPDSTVLSQHLLSVYCVPIAPTRGLSSPDQNSSGVGELNKDG